MRDTSATHTTPTNTSSEGESAGKRDYSIVHKKVYNFFNSVLLSLKQNEDSYGKHRDNWSQESHR